MAASTSAPVASLPDQAGARSNRRRVWAWLAFLALSPICLGIVAWAALRWDGGYPTVASSVPAGWQAVRGVYASFSVPKSWSLQQYMSDAAGDVYYSGPGGSAGESVTQAMTPPKAGEVPAVVGAFLGGRYRMQSIHRVHLLHADVAWRYTFRTSARTGTAISAWDKATQSEVWLVTVPASPTTQKVLATLALAS